jgi:large subunit ribosomal protein L22
MDKKFIAKAKYTYNSPRKVRLVVDLIRGKNALFALDILKNLNKSASTDVYKVLHSAISNAVNNGGMSKENLVVSEVFVDEAPTFKRGMAVGRGKYHQIFKRNSHITVSVKEVSNDSKVNSKSNNK